MPLVVAKDQKVNPRFVLLIQKMIGIRLKRRSPKSVINEVMAFRVLDYPSDGGLDLLEKPVAQLETTLDVIKI